MTIRDRKPYKPSMAMLKLTGAARLAKSRPANPNMPSTANTESNEKLSVPGPIIITHKYKHFGHSSLH